jgi:ubiquinone/menaquinone biosynthesis C-methylase UbiE
MAPDTVAMLDRFGPMQGWTCLDIGCGPGGITDLLSVRVGPAGRVIGLDMNAEFLESARMGAPENVEFRLGDAYGSDLPAATFDLVHMRFVASTAGSPEHLLKEATRLVRRGGIVALQEPDGSTLNCYPPHPAWEQLKSALIEAFKGVGADLELARKLYLLVFIVPFFQMMDGHGLPPFIGDVPGYGRALGRRAPVFTGPIARHCWICSPSELTQRGKRPVVPRLC